MRKLYLQIKAAIVICGVIAQWMAAHFWMGTREEWNEAFNANPVALISLRLAFTVCAGTPFWFLSRGLDWLFIKLVDKSIGKKEYAVLVVLAGVFVAFTVVMQT